MSNGILLVNKAKGTLSFRLVSMLRRRTRIDRIGHAGTLDPFATGLMVMLIGKEYTKRSNEFLFADKEYQATVHLGIETDTYDLDGAVVAKSDFIPSLEQVEKALSSFQGQVEQVPPMYSAKKIQGKKLYDLARQGIVVERKAVLVSLKIDLLRYEYPNVELRVVCSKGTYIRSLAHDLGNLLGTGAHLTALNRLCSGGFSLQKAVEESQLLDPQFDLTPYLVL